MQNPYNYLNLLSDFCWTVTQLVLESGEYITHISGKHGLCEHDCQRHIASIKIHTNLRPNGYGPYGEAIDVSNVVSFSTTCESGSPIVGLFGKAGRYLDSIGAYVKKVSLVFGSERFFFHYCCLLLMHHSRINDLHDESTSTTILLSLSFFPLSFSPLKCHQY